MPRLEATIFFFPAGASVLFAGSVASLLANALDPGEPGGRNNGDAVGFVYTHESATGYVECHQIFRVDHVEGARGAGGGVDGFD